MMWTWEMCKNNFKGISDSACSPPGPCRWDWFLSLPSAWFHIVTDVQFSRGSISAFRQVRARHGAARGGGGGVQKPNHMRNSREGIQQSLLAAVGAGGWLWAAWLGWTGVLLLIFEKTRLYIFLAHVWGSARLSPMRRIALLTAIFFHLLSIQKCARLCLYYEEYLNKKVTWVKRACKENLEFKFRWQLQLNTAEESEFEI